MRPDDKDTLGIDTLVSETRASREALHALVLRMRGDRLAWERDAAGLAERVRLTPAQRHELRRRPPAPDERSD